MTATIETSHTSLCSSRSTTERSKNRLLRFMGERQLCRKTSSRLSGAGLAWSELQLPHPVAAAAAEDSNAVAPAVDQLPLAEELLDGGEIVLLAVRPSPWFVVFDSARWIAIGVLLLIASAMQSVNMAGLSNQSLAELGCVMVLARMGIAVLRWVSHFYILTNRRVMRLRGVFRADILSCPLLEILNTRVSVGPHERLAGLGSILFVTEENRGDLNWYNIAKCEDVHSRIRRAIERAIDNQPHR